MQNMSGGKTALGLDTNVGALLCYLPLCAISLIYSIIVLVTDKDNRADAVSRVPVAAFDRHFIVVCHRTLYVYRGLLR